jgi:hypothetical protein
VVIGEPLAPAESSADDPEELTQALFERVEQLRAEAAQA